MSHTIVNLSDVQEDIIVVTLNSSLFFNLLVG